MYRNNNVLLFPTKTALSLNPVSHKHGVFWQAPASSPHPLFISFHIWHIRISVSLWISARNLFGQINGPTDRQSVPKKLMSLNWFACCFCKNFFFPTGCIFSLAKKMRICVFMKYEHHRSGQQTAAKRRVMGSYFIPKDGMILWCSITSAWAPSVNLRQFSLITQQNSAANFSCEKNFLRC